MTGYDREVFRTFLRTCTNREVLMVLAAERRADRNVYARMARNEAQRRGLSVGDRLAFS
jgi:hypothetical protein